MDRLWAPWRNKYITAKKQKSCIFCSANKKSDYVFIKTQLSVAMLNAFPYNNGHILVAPLRHIKDLKNLKENELLDLFNTINRAIALLNKILRPKGYNVGINMGRVAGAGIPGHIHFHIVPRWNGDTNFMSTINSTRVISQSLDELCKRLKNGK